MRIFLTWLAILIAGIALGTGAAVWHIRSSGLGNDIRVGPWSTGRNVGTADADLRTRAIVALRGLLALPPGEARYFTATTDSAGRVLDGRCSYAVRGEAMRARWWSITLYDQQGWLVPNRWQRHSVSSAEAGRAAAGNWLVKIDPQPETTATIVTGRSGPFELTLRAYRPTGALASNPGAVRMPIIDRMDCGA